jgi:hypothetical protein
MSQARVLLLNVKGDTVATALADEFITAPLVLLHDGRTFLREGMRGAPLVNGDRYREVMNHALDPALVLPAQKQLTA